MRVKPFSSFGVDDQANRGLSLAPCLESEDFAWYCARTKPKHESIAAANLRQRLGLDVFNPQLRVKRATIRGPVRVCEPLFPCYVFVRCVLTQSLGEIRFTDGISAFVHFGEKIPSVPDWVIADLRSSFGSDESIKVEDNLALGTQVMVASGAFAGMNASVLRVLSTGQRVQVLLEMLGRPTAVEVERSLLTVEKDTLAHCLPALAMPRQDLVRA